MEFVFALVKPAVELEPGYQGLSCIYCVDLVVFRPLRRYRGIDVVLRRVSSGIDGTSIIP